MMTSKSWGEKAHVACWECRKRRLVCDQILPSCRKCRRAGRDCPGYSQQRPLQWIEPGKVTSGRRKKESTANKTPTCLRHEEKPKTPETDHGFFVWSAVDSEAESSGCGRIVQVDEDSKAHVDQEQIYRGCTTDHENRGARDGRLTAKALRNLQPLQKKRMRVVQWQIPLNSVTDSILHPSLDQRGVHLFKLYASRTSLTLAGPHSQDMWRAYAMDDAKGNEFLMHGLLSLSALHASGMESGETDDLVSIAYRYHRSAVSSFRARVTEITPENSQAVAMFSILMGIFSLGIPSIHGFPPGSSPISMFIDIIGLWRKAWSTIGSDLDEIKKGPLRPLLNADVPASPFPLPPDTLIWLGQLENYVKLYGGSAEDQKIYMDNFQMVLEYFWCLPQFSPFTLMICWSLNMSDRFFELLHEQKPFPLFLLSHLMLTFYHAPNVWLSPWSKHIIRETWSKLDEPLRNIFDWPATYIGIVPSTVHPDECRCFDCYMSGKDSELRWKDNATPLLTKLPFR